MLNLEMSTSPVLPSMGLINQIHNQALHTKPSRRSVKRVSWAPENDLCQVRLFVADDAPMQAAHLGAQDQLQAKKTWSWNGTESGVEYDLPPGFGRNIPTHYRQEEPSMVPQTAWRLPPRFVINPQWQVVAGDESEEIRTQCEREVRVLEAVYPRASAIPPSPAEPVEPQEQYDDYETPLIPLMPIEEEEAGDFDEANCSNESLQSSGNISNGVPQVAGNKNLEPFLNSTAMHSYCDTSNTIGIDELKHIPKFPANSSIEPDIVAAAKTAFLAIMRSNEEGSNIDPDLLIKILSNPQIIQSLSKNNNSQMEGISSSLPINNIVNGNESSHRGQHKVNPSNISKPQVPPMVNLGTNKSKVFTTENVSSQIQAPLIPPISEVKLFVSSEMGPRLSEGLELSNSKNKPIPMVTSVNGHATTQFTPRSATIPITSMANVVCQIQKGVPATTQLLSGPKFTPQNEQYYKKLIQQHGGQQGIERGAHLQPVHLGGQCGVDINKSKFRKPCMYFNSPKGCRRGASCTFLHEAVDRPKLDESEIQQGKRPKLEIEASGRH